MRYLDTQGRWRARRHQLPLAACHEGFNDVGALGSLAQWWAMGQLIIVCRSYFNLVIVGFDLIIKSNRHYRPLL
jgi:hypothetical protein